MSTKLPNSNEAPSAFESLFFTATIKQERAGLYG
jgi:hypothetical protein